MARWWAEEILAEFVAGRYTFADVEAAVEEAGEFAQIETEVEATR